MAGRGQAIPPPMPPLSGPGGTAENRTSRRFPHRRQTWWSGPQGRSSAGCRCTYEWNPRTQNTGLLVTGSNGRNAGRRPTRSSDPAASDRGPLFPRHPAADARMTGPRMRRADRSDAREVVMEIAVVFESMFGATHDVADA